MVKKQILLAGLLSLVFASSAANACSCSDRTTFINLSQDRETVVLATIVSLNSKLHSDERTYRSVTVRVDEVLKGTMKDDSTTATVLGGDGLSCIDKITASKFREEAQYLIVLPGDVENGYFASCSQYSISVSNREVVFRRQGRGTESVRYSLKEISELIK
ncbi:MAG: hypothetical protein WDZ52_10580 [Pseudohongiellaceae bacterium]